MQEERGVRWMVVTRTFLSVGILLALWLQTVANGREISALRTELSAALEQMEGAPE